MTIHKIEHEMNFKERSAVVKLNVEQIMYISNALYHATKEQHPTETLLELHRDFYLLFEVVKNGCIDSVTVEHLGNCQRKIDDLKQEERK